MAFWMQMAPRPLASAAHYARCVRPAAFVSGGGGA